MTKMKEREGGDFSMDIVNRIRTWLREWLGVVYLDRHLSGRIRDLERWRDSCIVAVPVDKHFKGKDIIILAGRFGLEDRVKIISIEFGSINDMVRLARSLEGNLAPKPRFFWDGPPGFTQAMQGALDE